MARLRVPCGSLSMTRDESSASLMLTRVAMSFSSNMSQWVCNDYTPSAAANREPREDDYADPIREVATTQISFSRSWVLRPQSSAAAWRASRLSAAGRRWYWTSGMCETPAQRLRHPLGQDVLRGDEFVHVLPRELRQHGIQTPLNLVGTEP